MTFWSGETLAAKRESLIVDFRDDHVDCNAYTLHVGPEAFVTSPDEDDDPKARTAIKLAEGDTFRILAGQFALIVTEETVRVPRDAMAFISMKTTQKLKGLINVSGFHVDPGWNGHLLFGVYNAGASSVTLRRGMGMFLIWYAGLDRTTAKVYENSKGRGGPEIPSSNMDAMSGDIFSPMRLAADIATAKTEASKLVDRLRTDGTRLVEGVRTDVTNKVEGLRTEFNSVSNRVNVLLGLAIPLIVAGILAGVPILVRVAIAQWPPAISAIGTLLGGGEPDEPASVAPVETPRPAALVPVEPPAAPPVAPAVTPPPAQLPAGGQPPAQN